MRNTPGIITHEVDSGGVVVLADGAVVLALDQLGSLSLAIEVR